MWLVTRKELQRHLTDFEEIRKAVVDSAICMAEIRRQITEVNRTPVSHQSRIEDLEIWRKKIHDVLVDKTPSGKDKPTRIGREIGKKLY